MSPPTMTGSRLGNSVPRASGDEPDLPVEIHVTPPVFPARAGMSPHRMRAYACRLSVPRASGDEPHSKQTKGQIMECSPRERG